MENNEIILKVQKIRQKINQGNTNDSDVNEALEIEKNTEESIKNSQLNKQIGPEIETAKENRLEALERMGIPKDDARNMLEKDIKDTIMRIIYNMFILNKDLYKGGAL